MDELILKQVRDKANLWLSDSYDEETRATVAKMISDSDPSELVESFYKNLEFGTGGLRGIMGAGSNRMNRYTVGAATQGLANYINKVFTNIAVKKVVIGHDCRDNSRFFAETVAGIFAANGIEAYLFDDLRPTPEISFAIRHLKCQGGVMITASHNPKEYNGYKAYWDDGAQVIAPHDKNIIDEVNKITDSRAIKFDGPLELVKILGKEIDDLFIEAVRSIALNPETIKKHHDLKIVFSPIHGATYKIMPTALRAYGFSNIINVPEQDVVSGKFPTVVSPNPEEPEALKMAIEKALETGADLVAASDPDGDRLGIAIRNDKNEFVLVNGNQTALLITWYMLSQWKAKGLLTGKEYIVKTIVTTELISKITKRYGVEYYDVYTGFKWIASIIREQELNKKYICGGEESYGFLPGDYVRDKDSVGSICMIAEIMAHAREKGKTLYELLQDIYIEYGFSHERLLSITRQGKSGADQIRAMMENFRANTPKTLGGSAVTLVKDYLTLTACCPATGVKSPIIQPEPADVLQFFTESGAKVSVRPSGTEPKIKFYFEVNVALAGKNEIGEVTSIANALIDSIIKDLKIN